MKRSISLSLSILLILSLCSCQNDTSENEQTTVQTTESSSETQTDPYGYIAPDIPAGLDYKGRDFCIAYPDWSTYRTYFFAETENGEVVNDACYRRMSSVEEALNISFTLHSYVGADVYSVAEKVVTAGLDDYDLYLTHNSIGLIGMLSGGFVMNWNDISSVDLDKPYYNQTVRENFEIDGILPYMSSDFLLPDVNAIFFNTEMISSYKLENPYTLVKDGKWTFDKLTEMSQAATIDIDGNNIFDENDQYGFTSNHDWELTGIITAGDQRMVEKTTDGGLEIRYGDERARNIIEFFREFLFKSGSAYTWDHSPATDPNVGGTPPVSFADGKSLFYQAPLSYFEFMRDSEIDYGILPFPKFDENQAEYLSLNWAGYMCILQTASDPELTGYVVEILSAESCRTVIPAFYEELLGEKIAREPDAVEVLDMIFNNTVYDLGVFSDAYLFIVSLMDNPDSGYSSTLDSNIAVYEKSLDDYIKGCQAMND